VRDQLCVGKHFECPVAVSLNSRVVELVAYVCVYLRSCLIRINSFCCFYFRTRWRFL